MCGILAVFGSSLSDIELRKKVIECSQRLRHRGPDWSGYLVETGNGIGHERLAIIDPESGAQPLYSKDKNIVVAANGEIYNYKELYAGLKKPYAPLTGSDCEVCIPLYEEVSVLLTQIYSFRYGISQILNQA
jgi:asparagine synthase (glutamine-hydrolysing)